MSDVSGAAGIRWYGVAGELESDHSITAFSGNYRGDGPIQFPCRPREMLVQRPEGAVVGAMVTSATDTPEYDRVGPGTDLLVVSRPIPGQQDEFAVLHWSRLHPEHRPLLPVCFDHDIRRPAEPLRHARDVLRVILWLGRLVAV